MKFFKRGATFIPWATSIPESKVYIFTQFLKNVTPRNICFNIWCCDFWWISCWYTRKKYCIMQFGFFEENVTQKTKAIFVVTNCWSLKLWFISTYTVCNYIRRGWEFMLSPFMFPYVGSSWNSEQDQYILQSESGKVAFHGRHVQNQYREMDFLYGGFHLHLLVYPFVHQFYPRMTDLVESIFCNLLNYSLSNNFTVISK